ncbi:hydrogenase formation protein HypD [Clostridium botulinum]|nr:hydrogenase formation protein HypD [Clostridium botulinum]NFS54933.1 hydrogenase formation protein HypD [Clostridium botulinum]NFT18022.1 hydrogenase formation protein HypD [Clostridium botulinum]
MELINRFNDVSLCKTLLKEIEKNAMEKINIMEVCGTHTRSIYELGINKLLPENINLLSGPGCPICVTPVNYIDNAIKLSKKPQTIIVTFGDMMRVPGSSSFLSEEKAKGMDIRIIYSPLDSIKIAEKNKNKEVILLGIGFETTAPIIALTLKYAKAKKINNFSVLLSIKTMPNTMKELVLDGRAKINGFICPGHVATIIGEEPFNILSMESKLPMSICGFKGTEILVGILSIVKLVNNNEYKCENLYRGFVKKKGNIKAKELINEVFEISDSVWRGMGTIKQTGFDFKNEYKIFDATKKFLLRHRELNLNNNCICGEILQGISNPRDCLSFGKCCTPENPIGPCMVSNEGTCKIVYDTVLV